MESSLVVLTNTLLNLFDRILGDVPRLAEVGDDGGAPYLYLIITYHKYATVVVYL